MTTQENKGTARRIVSEIFRDHELSLIDELFAQDYVDHTLPPDVPPNREGLRQVILALQAAFPDLNYTIEHEVAEGDLVAQRLLGKGTLRGAFMGMPATGKSAVWQEMHLHRFDRAGKLAEHWGTNDDLGMLTQLGLAPSPQ
jgi:predicted ester cyclase